MLKKKLGIESIESDWPWGNRLETYFKLPSSLVIPDGCERVGDRAFRDCEELRKIDIPKSVKKIGGGAFEYCKKLREVVIPESVERIGTLAFAYCDNTTTIILRKPKKDFKFIGNSAFYYTKYVKEEIRS